MEVEVCHAMTFLALNDAKQAQAACSRAGYSSRLSYTWRPTGEYRLYFDKVALAVPVEDEWLPPEARAVAIERRQAEAYFKGLAQDHAGHYDGCGLRNAPLDLAWPAEQRGGDGG